MSGVVGLIGAPFRGASSFANEIERLILMKPRRSIGIVVPSIVINESHTDVVQVTHHPVQVSAAIADHAFKEPATVQILAGWSNSSALLDPTESFVKEIYDEILRVQEERELLDVYTGKRIYRNMLIVSVATQTTAQTEYALIANIICREVLTANVVAGVLTAAQQQSLPARTQSQIFRGLQTPVPVTPSAVLRGALGFPEIVQ